MWGGGGGREMALQRMVLMTGISTVPTVPRNHTDSDSDSLFTKFDNKESVSKAVSIQA